MKLIVGLGNIGDKYTTTRHNCGFILLDNLVQKLEEEGQQIKWKEESKLKSITAKAQIKGKEVLLAKPTTLMNLSGLAVSQLINFYKIPQEDLVVIYDDIDLPLGSIRIRQEGSGGTHNGMKSVIQELGHNEFVRIRIGIESRGETAPAHQDISSFVLSNFTEHEIPPLRDAVIESIKELEDLI